MKARILPLILLLAAFSCSRPSSREFFVTRENAEYGDTYSFSLDLRDTSWTYGLDFLARLERDSFDSFLSEDITLDLRWFSPSGQILVDTAYVRILDVVGGDYFSKDLISPYKSDLGLPESGDWRLNAKVVNNPGRLRGIGIILRSY